jgi:hypothetical protein
MTKPLVPKIAKIVDTFLGFEDHGIFAVNLTMDYGGAGQGTGHYSIINVAGPFLKGILGACGVDTWDRVKGRTVFALVEDEHNGFIRGLEPLPTEPGTRFIFADAFPEESK